MIQAGAYKLNEQEQGSVNQIARGVHVFVFDLFNRLTISTFATLCVFSLLTNSGSSTPLRNLIPFVLFLLGVITLASWNRFSRNPVFRALEGIAATFLVVLSLLKTDSTGRYPDLWLGFGVVPTAVVFGLSTYYLTNWRFGSSAKIWQTVGRVKRTIVIVALIAYAPLFIQPSYGLLNLGDTTYHVFDELLAPMTGKFPYFDYSPQYSALFGWILQPLGMTRISPGLTMNLVVVFCNVCICLIPVIMVSLMKKVSQGQAATSLLLCFVSFWCMSGPWNGSSIQIKEFATFSRYLPLILCAWLFTRIFNEAKGSALALKSGVLGIAVGLAVLNNPETGVVVLLAIGGALIVPLFQRSIDKRIVVSGLCGLVLPVSLYVGAGFLLKKFFLWESFQGIRLGGSNLYEFSELTFLGPHLLAISIGLTALIVGIANQLKGETIDGRRLLAALQVFSGITVLVLFLKFFFRPIIQGVPQFYVPVFLAGFLVVTDAGLKHARRLRNRSRSVIVLLPLSIVATIPVGALIQMPNPIDELRRIISDRSSDTTWSSFPGRPSDAWTPNSINRINDDLLVRVEDLATDLGWPAESVMYFGIHGNVVELTTSVKNGLGIPAPESMRFGGNQLLLACLPIERQLPRFVISYDTDFPCLGYQISDVLPMSEKYRIYELND